MQIVKPPHNKYLFRGLNAAEYHECVIKYQTAKKLGFRGICAFLSGYGIVNIGFELAKGQVRYYGRRKTGVVIAGAVGWLAGPVLPMLTNSTKVVKVFKVVHNSVSFCMEWSEDLGCAYMFPLDLMLFGQPIPVGEQGRFNLMGSTLDILDGLGDD